jgi:hypothetical protein
MDKRRPFDDILQECILRMEAGQDLESALANYPDRSRELRPHLQVLVALSSAQKQDASPQGTVRGRYQLMGALSAPGPMKGGARTMLNLRGSTGRSLALFSAGAVAALTMMFLAGGLGFGSGSQKAEAGPIATCILTLDFNHDGVLNVQDVAAFKAAIKSQDLAFDFNGDGTVDVFDVSAAVQNMVACIQQIQPPPAPTPSVVP